MPEDVIARAIAEQASRSPQELGTVVPGVLVALGETGLSTASALRRRLESGAALRQAASAIQTVIIGSQGLAAPDDLGRDLLIVDPDWSPDRIRLRHLDEWLAPDVSRNQPGPAGSGCNRQADRLAYFTHYSEIRARLAAARDRALAGFRASPTACTFYIVTQLGDAVGSGMVFDVAHLCQELLGDLPDGQVVGFLVLPGSTDGQEPPLAGPNAFAALKELDFFNAAGELPVRYAPGAPAQVLANPLFSACYLVDGPKPGSDRPGEWAIADAVALQIFGEFLTGGFGASLRASRERLSRFARPGREDRSGCQTAYRASGAARLFVSAARSSRAHSLLIGDRLLARILSPGESDLASAAARFVTPWSPGDLGGGLVKRLAADPGGTLRDVVARWPAELAARLEREGLPRHPRAWLDARIAELRDRFADAEDSLLAPIARNLNDAIFAFEAELDTEMMRLSQENSHCDWYGSTLRLLEQLELRLGIHVAQAGEAREKDREVLGSCERLLDERLSEVERAFGHPLAKLGGTWRMVTERGLAGLWRTLEEVLIVHLRLSLWNTVPAFHDAAQAGVRRRHASQKTAADKVRALHQRTRVALDGLRHEPIPAGELFHPDWTAEAVDELPPDAVEALAGKLLARLGAASPYELAGRAGTSEFEVDLASALRDASDELAGQLRPRSAAERFGHLFPTEAARREALRTALASAAPRLDLEARDGADMPPADAQSLVIGIPGGPANPHGDFAELLDLLLLCLDDLGLRMPVSISDIAGAGDQILIVRECAGFPLRCAAAIDGLAARYREWVRQPKAEPVHMAKDPGAFETIPGLFPPDEKTKTRALEAFVVGVGWGVFDIENGVVVYRQKLPGMTFLDTRIIGTVDRPLRAVKYLVDHPDLVQFALGRIEDIVADCRRDSALRNDRLARLERYYLRILEQCRRIAEGDEGSLEKAPDDRIRRLPLWDLAETVLTFNAKHGLVADADAEAESGGSVPAGDPLRSSRPLVGPEGSRPTDADAEADADADARAETGHTRAHQVAPASVAAAQTSFEVLAPAVGADSVQCSACQSIWPDSAKYCAECAAPLRRADTCPSCHSSTPPGGKFCPECAAPLKAGWERSRTQS